MPARRLAGAPLRRWNSPRDHQQNGPPAGGLRDEVAKPNEIQSDRQLLRIGWEGEGEEIKSKSTDRGVSNRPWATDGGGSACRANGPEGQPSKLCRPSHGSPVALTSTRTTMRTAKCDSCEACEATRVVEMAQIGTVGRGLGWLWCGRGPWCSPTGWPLADRPAVRSGRKPAVTPRHPPRVSLGTAMCVTTQGRSDCIVVAEQDAALPTSALES